MLLLCSCCAFIVFPAGPAALLAGVRFCPTFAATVFVTLWDCPVSDENGPRLAVPGPLSALGKNMEAAGIEPGNIPTAWYR